MFRLVSAAEWLVAGQQYPDIAVSGELEWVADCSGPDEWLFLNGRAVTRAPPNDQPCARQLLLRRAINPHNPRISVDVERLSRLQRHPEAGFRLARDFDLEAWDAAMDHEAETEVQGY